MPWSPSLWTEIEFPVNSRITYPKTGDTISDSKSIRTGLEGTAEHYHLSFQFIHHLPIDTIIPSISESYLADEAYRDNFSI